MALLAAATLAGAVAPAASADRPASKAERAAIAAKALDACGNPDCELRRVRVSTSGRRYAWADVVTEGFSGVLLKRPSRRSHRFRVIGTQGGGIGECSYWRRRAPRRVLRDLRISGVVDDAGTTRNCGRRG